MPSLWVRPGGRFIIRFPMLSRPTCWNTLWTAAMALASLAAPAGAIMDINDRGPVLDAGRFALRLYRDHRRGRL